MTLFWTALEVNNKDKDTSVSTTSHHSEAVTKKKKKTSLKDEQFLLAQDSHCLSHGHLTPTAPQLWNRVKVHIMASRMVHTSHILKSRHEMIERR